MAGVCFVGVCLLGCVFLLFLCVFVWFTGFVDDFTCCLVAVGLLAVGLTGG